MAKFFKHREFRGFSFGALKGHSTFVEFLSKWIHLLRYENVLFHPHGYYTFITFMAKLTYTAILWPGAARTVCIRTYILGTSEAVGNSERNDSIGLLQNLLLFLLCCFMLLYCTGSEALCWLCQIMLQGYMDKKVGKLILTTGQF